MITRNSFAFLLVLLARDRMSARSDSGPPTDAMQAAPPNPSVADEVIRCLVTRIESSADVEDFDGTRMLSTVPRGGQWTREKILEFETALVSSLQDLVMSSDREVDYSLSIVSKILSTCFRQHAGVGGGKYAEKMRSLLERWVEENSSEDTHFRAGNRVGSAPPDDRIFGRGAANSEFSCGPESSDTSAWKTPNKAAVEEAWIESLDTTSDVPGKLLQQTLQPASPIQEQKLYHARNKISRQSEAGHAQNSAKEIKLLAETIREADRMESSESIRSNNFVQNSLPRDKTLSAGSKKAEVARARRENDWMKNRFGSRVQETGSKGTRNKMISDTSSSEQSSTSHSSTEIDSEAVASFTTSVLQVMANSASLGKSFGEAMTLSHSSNTYRDIVYNIALKLGLPDPAVLANHISEKIRFDSINPETLAIQTTDAIARCVASRGILSLGNSESIASRYFNTMETFSNSVNLNDSPSSHIEALIIGQLQFLLDVGVLSPENLQRLRNKNEAERPALTDGPLPVQGFSHPSVLEQIPLTTAVSKSRKSLGPRLNVLSDSLSVFKSSAEAAITTSAAFSSTFDRIKYQPLIPSDFYSLVLTAAQLNGMSNPKQVAQRLLDSLGPKLSATNPSCYAQVSTEAVGKMLMSENILRSQNAHKLALSYVNVLEDALKATRAVHSQKAFFQLLADSSAQYLISLGILTPDAMNVFSRHFSKEILSAAGGNDPAILEPYDESVGESSGSSQTTNAFIISNSAASSSNSVSKSIKSENLAAGSLFSNTLSGSSNSENLDSSVLYLNSLSEITKSENFALASSLPKASSTAKTETDHAFHSSLSQAIASGLKISTSLARRTLFKYLEKNAKKLKLSNSKSVEKIAATFFEDTSHDLKLSSLITLASNSVAELLRDENILTPDNYEEITSSFSNALAQRFNSKKSSTDTTPFVQAIMHGLVDFVTSQNISGKKSLLKLAKIFNSHYSASQDIPKVKARASAAAAESTALSSSSNYQQASTSESKAESQAFESTEIKNSVDSYKSAFASSMSNAIASSASLANIFNSEISLPTTSSAFRDYLHEFAEPLDLTDLNSIAEMVSKAYSNFPDTVPFPVLIETSAGAFAHLLSRKGILTSRNTAELSRAYADSLVRSFQTLPSTDDAYSITQAAIKGAFNFLQSQNIGGTEDLLNVSSLFNSHYHNRNSDVEKAARISSNYLQTSTNEMKSRAFESTSETKNAVDAYVSSVAKAGSSS